ncbi:hypothetical protein [Geothermobacter hydrogeniphilus]|uniref:hypothetical protein n=1 Tax=Geothermobacter hydrogeniphilus TaxID=1969733 RepID=UPI0011AFAB9B|nr:hypothetical protein [Geothermobacter hydrogeniphilus]
MRTSIIVILLLTICGCASKLNSRNIDNRISEYSNLKYSEVFNKLKIKLNRSRIYRRITNTYSESYKFEKLIGTTAYYSYGQADICGQIRAVSQPFFLGWEYSVGRINFGSDVSTAEEVYALSRIVCAMNQ